MTTEEKKYKAQEGLQTPIKTQRRIPWWVSIICAIATYCTFTYILPNLKPGSQTLYDLFQMGPTAAPVLTIPLLLLAAKQLYDTDIPSEEIDEQNPEDK